MKNTRTTNRFVIDYNTSLDNETKMLICDHITPSMVSPNGDSAQYCLTDVIDGLYDVCDKGKFSLPDGDRDWLFTMDKEGVDYIEICF